MTKVMEEALEDAVKEVVDEAMKRQATMVKQVKADLLLRAESAKPSFKAIILKKVNELDEVKFTRKELEDEAREMFLAKL